jgi:NCAIR mutase (PurE)-related protein
MSRLESVLERVARGELAPADALALLQQESDLGFAKLDLGRDRRCGDGEVVFCPGKSPDQAAAIAAELLARNGRVLLTRVEPAQRQALERSLPDARWHEAARCVTIGGDAPERIGRVTILTGGTADLAVAEEAAVTARFCGAHVELIPDVGVAGLHRLLSRLEMVRRSDVVIVAAGMDGALASVVSGLVRCPVVAVPTSAGYGASFGGIAPLLTMLNACAGGVAVVNIDNGFGASYLAARICRTAAAYLRADPTATTPP